MNGTTSLALTPDVTILHSHRISDILSQWFSTSLYIRLTWENFERCLSASKIKRNANTGYLHNYREKSPLTLLIRMWIWISFSIEENLVIYIKNITRPRYLTFKNALWALNYCKYKRIVGKTCSLCHYLLQQNINSPDVVGSWLNIEIFLFIFYSFGIATWSSIQFKTLMGKWGQHA